MLAAERKGAKSMSARLLFRIAAGTRLATLEQGTRRKLCGLVRVMPNTPCLIGQGASAFCLGRNATEDDGELVQQLLSAIGFAVAVEEKMLDAVTGLSGSGPAFVYVIIEALSDGATSACRPVRRAGRRFGTGRADGPRRGADGPHDGRTSGRAQGSRRQSRRDDNCGAAGVGTSGDTRRTDGRRGSSDTPVNRNGIN